jgi:ribosome maturation factor RimP
MRSAIEGRRKFQGSIVKLDGDNIFLHVDGEDYELPHADIDKANIVYAD